MSLTLCYLDRRKARSFLNRTSVMVSDIRGTSSGLNTLRGLS